MIGEKSWEEKGEGGLRLSSVFCILRVEPLSIVQAFLLVAIGAVKLSNLSKLKARYNHETYIMVKLETHSWHTIASH